MRRAFVTWIVAMSVMVVGLPAAAQQGTGCGTGETQSEGAPPGPAGSSTAPRCEADQPTPEDRTHASDQPSGGMSAQGATTNSYWSRISTNNYRSLGVASQLRPVDPAVTRSTNDYLTQHVRLWGCGTGRFTEVGWGEFGWRGDVQYVYTYDNVSGQFRIFDQYVVSPNDFDPRLWVEIAPAGGSSFASWVWRNGTWNLLNTVDLWASQACQAEAQVEVYVPTTQKRFPFTPSTIRFGNGTHNSYSDMGLIDGTNGGYFPWDTSAAFGTIEDLNGGNYYMGTIQGRYYNWWVEHRNQAPSASVSVSPNFGDTTTVFSASVSGSDPNGDSVAYSIDWGDGTVTAGQSGTHTYSAAGSYTVRGLVTDQWGTRTVSPGQSVSVSQSNRPPTARLSVTPTRGDLTTTFTASLGASSDPDGDQLSYEIDWGDGTIDRTPEANHQYTSPGDYRVEGTVTDPDGATSSTVVPVEVCTIGSINCEASPDGPCPIDCSSLPEPVEVCHENATPESPTCSISISQRGQVHVVPELQADEGYGFRRGSCGSMGGGEADDLSVPRPIGPDERTKVDDTTKCANRRFVYISGRFPWANEDLGCSGFLVGPDTVVTAAHCLYDRPPQGGDSRYARNIRVYPGRQQDQTPFGSCGVRDKWVMEQWAERRKITFDVGALELDCAIGDRIGWLGYYWESGSRLGETTKIIGYSGRNDPKFAHRAAMWKSTDRVRDQTRRRLFYRNDTAPGGSGASVFNDELYDVSGNRLCVRCAIAIHTKAATGGEPPEGNNNSAVRITRAIFEHIERWRQR